MSAKMELAARVAAGCTRFPVDINSATTAAYARKYTVAELQTLEAALSYADQHSRPARHLFDAAAYSQGKRKIAGASAEGVLKTALTAADADAWYAANFPAKTVDQEPGPDAGPNVDGSAVDGSAVDGSAPVKVFLVVVDTRMGLFDVELIATSSERAASRARWSLIHARNYGDIDQVQWISVEEAVCRYMAMCGNTATRFIEMPQTFGPDGERNETRIPVCQKCRDFYDRQGAPKDTI